jgi:hypothetical protein
MAGNVKEWCLNEGNDGKRLILGGGFDEPRYMFHFTDQQSPWDRRSNFGFRCVKLDSPVTTDAAARVVDATRDYWKEKPVSDEVFKAYTALYAYDKGALNARVEETAVIENGSRSKVTFDAAYGHERVTAYLFLPISSEERCTTAPDDCDFPGCDCLSGRQARFGRHRVRPGLSVEERAGADVPDLQGRV